MKKIKTKKYIQAQANMKLIITHAEDKEHWAIYRNVWGTLEKGNPVLIQDHYYNKEQAYQNAINMAKKTGEDVVIDY